MASMEQIEASRTVDRLEHDAETQWRTDGSDGSLDTVTIDVLRDKLIDSLADVEPMRKLVKLVNEGATDTLDGMRYSDRVAALIREAKDAGEGGEEIINCYDVVKMARPEQLAGHLLELLEAAVRFYSSRAPAAASDDLPAILHVPLPPRTKRIRTGATTVMLPFLFSHLEGVNVAVNDPLPSPLAPVVTEKKKRKPSPKKAA